jgi:hypothetical protein
MTATLLTLRKGRAEFREGAPAALIISADVRIAAK